MDASSITALVTSAYLAFQNYLPDLANKAAGALGSRVPEAIAKLWSVVQQRFEEKPSAKEALVDLLKKPNDPDIQAAFRVQFKKLLEEDDFFATEVNRILGTTPSLNFNSSQTGSGNITVQGTGNIVDIGKQQNQ